MMTLPFKKDKLSILFKIKNELEQIDLAIKSTLE